MTIFDAILLGVVQGVTEFLPISSTGHLLLARDLLGLPLEHSLAFDAILQLATAFAILIYFSKDVVELIRSFWGLLRTLPSRFSKNSAGSLDEHERQERTVVLGIILATIPAVILGLLLEDYIDTTFRSVSVVLVGLVAGAVLMVVAERLLKQPRDLSVGRALTVGFFQALALIPGMSRSGSTISGGMLVGLSREQATRFSFLLGLPILFGTGFKKLLEVESIPQVELVALIVGSAVAFLTGWLAIRFLLRYLKTHTLYPFVVYRIVLVILILTLGL